VVAKVRERLAVGKRTTQKLDVKFKLKKLNGEEGREQY
jgi:hypothetical protein